MAIQSYNQFTRFGGVRMKTILKLYPNGDVETIDTPLIVGNDPFQNTRSEGGYIGRDGGYVESLEDITCDFLKVIPNETYTLSVVWDDAIAVGHWLRIAHYSDDLTFMGTGFDYDYRAENSFSHNWTCPQNVSYIRISMIYGASVIFKKKSDTENKISFSEQAIRAPRIIEYPPTGTRNYFIEKTLTRGYIYSEDGGGVLSANEHDVTTDFIDVRGWGNGVVRVTLENLDGAYSGFISILGYNASRQFSTIFFEDYITGETPTGRVVFENTFPITAEYMRLAVNYYDNPNVKVKVSIERGTVATQKHYLAPEDLPTWVRDTGKPVSIFPEGIVIKGQLLVGESEIVPPQPTIVKSGLLSYHNVKQGISGTNWQNLAPNRTQTALLRNMVINGENLANNKSWGSDIEFTIPNEMNSIVSPFTLEIRFSASEASSAWLSGYHTTIPSIYTYGSISATGIWLSLLREDLTATIGNSFSTPLTPNTFYTYSIVYDGAYSLSGYVNGALVRTVTTTQRLRLNHNNLNLIHFGESTTATNTFKFIRLYNRALTQEEITNNYNVGDGIGL